MRMGWLVMMLVLGGCSWERHVKRLSDAEFDHYYALRSFMDESQRETYLKLKTEEERNAYLKELGLWDRFYKYNEAEREQIIAGRVEMGWSKDWVLMAWGAPYDKQKLVGRDVERAEKMVYRFEEQPDGGVLVWEEGSKTAYTAVRLFRKELILENDVVVEIVEYDRF